MSFVHSHTHQVWKSTHTKRTPMRSMYCTSVCYRGVLGPSHLLVKNVVDHRPSLTDEHSGDT